MAKITRTYRFEKNLIERFDKIAEETGIGKTFVLTEAIINFVNKYEGEKKMYKLAGIKERVMGHEFSLEEGLSWGIQELIVDGDDNHAIVFDKRDTTKTESGSLQTFGYANIVDVDNNNEELFGFWVGYEYNDNSDFAKIIDVEA